MHFLLQYSRLLECLYSGVRQDVCFGAEGALSWLLTAPAQSLVQDESCWGKGMYLNRPKRATV